MVPDPSPELPIDGAPDLAAEETHPEQAPVDPRLAPFYKLQELRLQLQNDLITHPLAFGEFTKWKDREEAQCRAKPSRIRRLVMPTEIVHRLVVKFQAEADAFCGVLDNQGEPFTPSELIAAECEVNHWMSPGEFARWFNGIRKAWNEICDLKAQIVEENVPLAKNFLKRTHVPKWMTEDLLGELLLGLNACVDSFIPGVYAFTTYAYAFFNNVRLHFFEHTPIETYLDPDFGPADLVGVPDDSAIENDRQDYFKDIIAQGLACLDERSRLIITFRYGLDGEPPWTLEQIGQLAGKTREAIRQKEEKAMKVLAEYFIEEGKGAEIIRGLGE